MRVICPRCKGAKWSFGSKGFVAIICKGCNGVGVAEIPDEVIQAIKQKPIVAIIPRNKEGSK